MFFPRLTALSFIAAFLFGVASTLSVWSYIERGRTIKEQQDGLASRKAITDIVQDRATNEEEITNEKDSRIKAIDGIGKNNPMSPAIRAAIDSLYK